VALLRKMTCDWRHPMSPRHLPCKELYAGYFWEIWKCVVAMCCSVLRALVGVRFVWRGARWVLLRQDRSVLLQCVAVCCRVLQCLAVSCSVLQCLAVSCSVLQCLVIEVCCCSVLQCVEGCCSVVQCLAVSCSALQCVAVSCSVLRHYRIAAELTFEIYNVLNSIHSRRRSDLKYLDLKIGQFSCPLFWDIIESLQIWFLRYTTF